METPNIPKALIASRHQGLAYDAMSTSFFLGRKTIAPTARKGLGRLQDKLFVFLSKNAANPTDFFQIPPGRVLEMGGHVFDLQALVPASAVPAKSATSGRIGAVGTVA